MNTIVILQNPYLFMELMIKTVTMRLYATIVSPAARNLLRKARYIFKR